MPVGGRRSRSCATATATPGRCHPRAGEVLAQAYGGGPKSAFHTAPSACRLGDSPVLLACRSSAHNGRDRAAALALPSCVDVGFFDPPPVPPEPPPRQQLAAPEWMAPPDGVVPGIAVLEAVLVRTSSVAAWVGAAAVYPTGLVFAVEVRAARRDGEGGLIDGLLGHEPGWRRAEGDSDGWRFGVQLSDGGKATTLGVNFRGLFGLERPPEEPVLLPRGGSGGARAWLQEFWLWPLPPEGPLRLACAWPAVGIAETVHEVDTAPIRAAAQRAVVLWSEEP